MNIAQYQNRIREHNFLHDTNQTVTKAKYDNRPDPSCPECNPPNFSSQNSEQFVRFWGWYSRKYQATYITCITIDIFEEVYQTIGDIQLFNSILHLLITTIHYNNNQPPKEFKQIALELKDKWLETEQFNCTPENSEDFNQETDTESRLDIVHSDSNLSNPLANTLSRKIEKASNQIQQGINRAQSLITQLKSNLEPIEEETQSTSHFPPSNNQNNNTEPTFEQAYHQTVNQSSNMSRQARSESGRNNNNNNREEELQTNLYLPYESDRLAKERREPVNQDR